MSYSRNQYSNCNWTATGELECDGKVIPNTGVIIPNPNVSDNLRHQSEFDNTVQTNDKYSNLNRELEVSVYAQNRPVLDVKDMIKDSLPIKKSSDNLHLTSLKPRIFQHVDLQTSLQPDPIPAQSLSHSYDPLLSSQIMWTQSSKYYEKFKKTSDKYYFQAPFSKYYDIVNEFGQPTILNPNKGGMAIWQRPSSHNTNYHIFQRIDILDEECFNRFPYPHIGFLYTYVCINVPLSILNRVLSISGDIMYDPIKHLLIVRGMSMNYNIALTVLVCQYVYGKISWYNMTENDLIRKITHHKQLTNIKNQKRNLKFLQTHFNLK